jgi:hypothetical protein
MVAQSNEPIRLTEGQTEMLTRALAEAARQAALPKSADTQFKVREIKPAPPAAKPQNKFRII